MEKSEDGKRRPKNYNWYKTLKVSKLNPPTWVFGVVWTFLYICIAISGFLYVRQAGFNNLGFAFYAIQMILNLIWSPLFFGKKMIRAAFADIVAMWIFILLTIIQFQKADTLAAYFLYPYIAWVSLATYLNLYIVLNNPVQHKSENLIK